MKKKQTSLRRGDIAFLVFLSAIILAIIIISIIISVKSEKEKVHVSPTPTPTSTSTPPSPTVTKTQEPSTEFDEVMQYEIPRQRRLSLNAFMNFETNIGGSESETITEVITLDDNYIIGSTKSTDFDFLAKNDSDVFLAVVDSGGTVLKTIAFGQEGEDIPLFAKPVTKLFDGEENGIIVVGKNTKNENDIYLYKVLVESLTSTFSKISLDKAVTISKVVTDFNGVYILAYDENRTYLFYVDRYLNVKCTKNVENVKGVDLLVYPNSALILAEDNSSHTLKIINLSTKGEENSNIDNFSDKMRAPIEFLPQKDGGFIITYKSMSSGVEKFGVLKINKTHTIEFDYEARAEGCEKFKVISTQNPNEESSAFLSIFATKANGDSIYESLCAHGDVLDISTTMFKNFDIEQISSNENGIAVYGTTKKDNNTDIIIKTFDHSMKELTSNTFGGSGNEAMTKAIVDKNGKLVLYCTTSSKDGDVGGNFGKNDVWIIYPEV